MHPSGEPDGDNRQRADDGRLPAKLVLLGGLPDGGFDSSPQVPEPRAGLGGMDDTGGRHGLLHPKLRRGCGATGEDDGHRSDGRHHAIENTQTII